MTDSFEILETEEVGVNNLQIFQQDKALITVQMQMAKIYPRNLKKAIDNAITIVTLDKETANSCMYSIKKGGKPITGPSVNLAKIVAQQFGNIRFENRVVSYDSTHVTCEGVCFDLERNFAMRTQIKKSIVGSSGRYSEDMCVITGNAGNSIALRNAIFSVIDASIIKKVYEAAIECITGDLSDENVFTRRKTTMIEGFIKTYHDYKLTAEIICASVGKAVVDHITKEDIVVLTGYERSIKEGEMTVMSVFFPDRNINTKVAASSEDKEDKRLLLLIEKSANKETLSKLAKQLSTQEQRSAYDKKFNSFK